MNIQKITILFFGVILLNASFLEAQENDTLEVTLEMCKALILENNEDAILASSKIKLSEEKIKEANTRFLPALSASSVGSAFTDNPILTSFAQYSVLSDVTLEQPIYLGGQIQSLSNLSKIEKEIAIGEKRLSDETLLYYVEQLYWQVIATEQQLVVATDYLETLTELENKISNFYKAGIINKTDLLETQVEKNRAVYNFEVSQNAVGVSKLQLGLATGIDKVSFTVVDEFFDNAKLYNYEDDLNTAYALRPEIEILQQSIMLKDEQSNLIKSNYRPQIGLSLGGYYYAGEETDPRAIETDQGFGAAFLNVTVPILKWGEKKHKLAQNSIEKEQIVLEESKTRDQISVQLQRAIDTIDEATIQVSLSEKSKLQAEENARLLNDNFEEGLVTSEEVLEAEALNQQAQLDYINARVSEQLSYSNYLKVMGKLSNNN